MADPVKAAQVVEMALKRARQAAKSARIAEYKDPVTTKAEDWKWKPLEGVADKLKIEAVPDYIQGGYGDFMKEQLKRAEKGDLNARDLIKAYTITQASIGRGGLSHSTATKHGLRLPNTGEEVRPEGAFAEWLGSPMGQRYLNAAELGKPDAAAMQQLRTMFSPYGKQDDQVAKMQWAADNLPNMAKDLNARVAGGRDEWRDYSDSLRGIAAAKSGFVGSLLGRGDIPTLDARQINLHTTPAPVSMGSIQNRGKGTGGRELVDRLAARQDALELGLDPSLAPFYQHLGHHAVWDKIGGTETTHNDLMKAMRGYDKGGAVHMEDGGITPRAFSFSPTDRDEHNRKLGLPAEFYRSGQTDPTMQSYGAGMSVPVGGARLTADAIASRNAQMRDTLAGIMLGAEFPVGSGTLRAEMMRPTMQGASPQYGLRYSRPFAEGGQVQRFDEGGDVNQAELDRMRLELANSPVIQATPQSTTQKMIGTVGGYMDQAGKFVSEAMKPIAETHPIRTFLTDMMIADPLKSAGAALQDYTKTSRDITEEQPYTRSPVTGSGQTLRLDPRVLDVAQFATPVIRGATKLAGAGAKAVAPFASKVDDMVRELYEAGTLPQPGLSIKDVTPKALAPANEQGFYSPTEAAALNLQRKSGNGQQFLNDILKGDNVRSEEVSNMGLDTFLKDKKNVTAAEVQDFIAQNKMRLDESRYGAVKEDPVGMEKRKEIFDSYQPEIDRLYKEHDAYFDAGDNAARRKVEEQIINVQLKRNLEAHSAYKLPISKHTRFEDWQLPGGENYREVVLTLPQTPEHSEFARLNKKMNEDGLLPDEMNRWTELGGDLGAEGRRQAKEGRYRTPHWEDVNPIAHIRLSDRVTDGKKTLLVDEVQSDWHQAARDIRTAEVKRLVETYNVSKEDAQKAVPKDYGYRIADPVKKNADGTFTVIQNDGTVMNFPATTDIDMLRGSFGADAGVPDAPYKDDWYQLALKRAVKEAIDGGYDRVALPTGERVADRFQLTHYIDRIAHKKNADGTYSLAAVDKEGRPALNDKSVPQDKLAGIVGKEVAQKIIDAEGKGYPKGSVSEDMLILSGLDLKTGGEGMKKYYDEIYPSYLKKFGKKYGATVGKTDVVTDNKANGILEANGKFFVISDDGINFKEFNNYTEAAKHLGVGVEPLHYMDITPAMRKEFKTGIHMKKGGAVHFADSLDAMRHELTKAK